eukprot:PhF_6_TR21220/c0_g1_i1/m.30660
MSEKKRPNQYGVFSDVSYISTDADPNKTDLYDKAEPLMSRYTGSNFKTNPPKRGKQGDALFGTRPGQQVEKKSTKKEDKEEKQVDDREVRKKKREEEEKKIRAISAKDFKYVSPAKKSTGPGSYFGTLQQKAYDHMEEYKVQTKQDPPPERPKLQKKNIMTRPPKKGTYGTTGHFFSLPEPLEIKLKDGKPVPNDPFDAAKQKEKEEWEKSKELLKKVCEKPWKSTCRPITFFDEKGSSGVSLVYSYDRPDEDKEKSDKKKKEPKEAKEGKEGAVKEAQKPFKYSSPAKSGWKGSLSPFPNTIIVDEKFEKELKESKEKGGGVYRREKYQSKEKLLGGQWVPVSTSKVGVTRSLLRRFY